MSNEFRIHIKKDHELYNYCVKLFFYNYYIRQEEKMRRRKSTVT